MLQSSDVGTTTMMNVAIGTSIYLPFLEGMWQALGAIPPPGQGPSKEEMDKGFLTLTAYASTASKSPKCKAVMKFMTDPGYKDTARMISEAALSLVDLPKSEKA